MTATGVRLWTVDEYHRMIEAEILTTSDRVELLEGQILEISPQQPPHAATTQWSFNYLSSLFVGQAFLRMQLPITLCPNSEPEPDIAVVRIDPRNYLDHHPTPNEIFLLIEVADSTLNRDCKLKASTYAKANIVDYWVVDVNGRRVYIFRQPGETNYQQEMILDEHTTISLLAFPDIAVQISCLFP